MTAEEKAARDAEVMHWRERAEKSEADLLLVYRFPEREWAEVASLVLRECAAVAQSDAPLAQRFKRYFDEGQTYVNNLRRRAEKAEAVVNAARAYREIYGTPMLPDQWREIRRALLDAIDAYDRETPAG